VVALALFGCAWGVVKLTLEDSNVNATYHSTQSNHGKELHLDLLLLTVFRLLSGKWHCIFVVFYPGSGQIEIHVVPAEIQP